MLKPTFHHLLVLIAISCCLVAIGFSHYPQEANFSERPAIESPHPSKKATVEKYTFKDKTIGAAAIFETSIESESAASGHDRLLSIKLDKSIEGCWNVVTVQIFNDQALRFEGSKEKLGPLLKRQHFYKLFRCDKEKYWVRLLLEPTGEISSDSWESSLQELEDIINQKRGILIRNSYFPVKLSK